MKRRISAAVLALLITITVLFQTACNYNENQEQQPEYTEEYKPDDAVQAEPAVVESTVGITLFSWQIPTPEYAEQYCAEIKNCGFDCVEVVILWSDIEPEQGKFSFNETDAVLDVFVKNGLKLSLSLLFWSERLDWKDSLDYQMTADGEVFRYDDTRGSFLCLNSEKNLSVITNTLGYFAAHFADRYANELVSWSIRTDCFAKMEYSSVADLDYSPQAIKAFTDYLEAKYIAIELFNKNFGTSVESFENLAVMGNSKLSSLCEYDWKLFKQQTLIDLTNLYTEIFRIADPSVPVTLHVSSFWDTSAAFYRGFFDPYVVSRETSVDIIQITDSPSWPHDFSVDLITSLSDKSISMETDGSWQGEDTFVDYLKQVELSAKSGVTVIQTVNWELEDLKEYGQTYLAKFKSLYVDAEERKDYDETDVIFVNTLDFLLKEPPKDLNDLYYYAYKNMTGSSGRKVRFITDTQILDDPTVLDGIKKIHLGSLDSVIHIRDEVGKALAECEAILVDDKNEQPNFINEYDQPLDEDIQIKLREKLKDS